VAATHQRDEGSSRRQAVDSLVALQQQVVTPVLQQLLLEVLRRVEIFARRVRTLTPTLHGASRHRPSIVS